MVKSEKNYEEMLEETEAEEPVEETVEAEEPATKSSSFWIILVLLIILAVIGLGIIVYALWPKLIPTI